jgi:hypothetical protein
MVIILGRQAAVLEMLHRRTEVCRDMHVAKQLPVSRCRDRLQSRYSSRAFKAEMILGVQYLFCLQIAVYCLVGHFVDVRTSYLDRQASRIPNKFPLVRGVMR